MRFKLFKMFESRTSELSETEFKRILHSKCKDFVNNPKLLKRDKSSGSSDFSYIDPKQHMRNPGGEISTTPSKHHILLMDNLPSWSKFPKRSKSIIGLTMCDDKQLFGTHRYLVIPFDNARFGVAPSCDLWGCRAKISYNQYLGFNDTFASIMIDSKISDESYTSMMSDLQDMYGEYRKGVFMETPLTLLFKQCQIDEFDDIEKAIDKYLSPDKFKGTDIDEIDKFSVVSYKDIPSSWPYEFWTDSECLLYYIGEIYNKDKITEKYQKFCSDFISIK